MKPFWGVYAHTKHTCNQIRWKYDEFFEFFFFRFPFSETKWKESFEVPFSFALFCSHSNCGICLTKLSFVIRNHSIFDSIQFPFLFVCGKSYPSSAFYLLQSRMLWYNWILRESFFDSFFFLGMKPNHQRPTFCICI